jgi:ribosomal protein S12 methylthiotransferase
MSTFAIVSLGCPKNQVDSEWLIDLLVRGGLLFCANSLESDLVIINTCAFIGSAREEAVDTILSYAAHCADSKDVKLAVTGCLVQGFGKEVIEGFPEVDFWIKGPNDIRGIEAILKHYRCKGQLPSPNACSRSLLLSEPGSAFLKISEGCDNRCNYCSIPLIKGPLVSRHLRAVIQDAEQLSANGVKEVNLIAQDLTAYGSDVKGSSENIIALIKALLKLPFKWIRLLYTYPRGMTDELIELIGSETRVCSYLDIPFQHSHENVLSKMGRVGDMTSYLKLVDKLRERVEGIAIRTTLMTGHPGEGTKEFKNLLKFVEEARFEWLGVFSYSPEEGTPSALASRPRESTAIRRAAEVMDLYREVRDTSAFFKKPVKEVLVTDLVNDILICRSETEAPEVDGVILVDGSSASDINTGDTAIVKLIGVDGMDFVGVLEQ